MQWHEALLWARGQAQANQGGYGLSAVRDVNAMFLDNFETPFLFEIAHPNEYNRRRTGGVPASPNAPPAAPHGFYWLDAQRIIMSNGGLLDLFLRYITGRASAANPPTATLTRYSTPGLTVIAALAGSRIFWRTSEANTPWPPNQLPAFRASLQSGQARAERGCALFGGIDYYGSFLYHPDSYTSNTMHEMAHVLYMRHQFSEPNYVHAVLPAPRGLSQRGPPPLCASGPETRHLGRDASGHDELVRAHRPARSPGRRAGPSRP